jgi:hypothetical protein
MQGKEKKRREQGDLSASSVPSDHVLKRIHRCTDTHFDPFSFVVVGVVDGLESQQERSLERRPDQDVFRYRPIDLGATHTKTEREPLRGVRECVVVVARQADLSHTQRGETRPERVAKGEVGIARGKGRLCDSLDEARALCFRAQCESICSRLEGRAFFWVRIKRDYW